jgi:hypothetical protein
MIKFLNNILFKQYTSNPCIYHPTNLLNFIYLMYLIYLFYILAGGMENNQKDKRLYKQQYNSKPLRFKNNQEELLHKKYPLKKIYFLCLLIVVATFHMSSYIISYSWKDFCLVLLGLYLM